MAERNPRIQYYDCARGIAMILVVASHIWAFNDTRYILFATTHNPTFFFISGSLMAVKATKNFRGGVIKKGVSLLLPYAVWVVILASISSISTGHLIGGIITASKELWFFPTLFIAETVLLLCIKFLKKKKAIAYFGIAIFLMMCFASFRQAAIARRLLFLELVILGYCIQSCSDKSKIYVSSLGAGCYILLIFAAYRKSFFTQIDNLVPGYKLLLIFLLSFAGMCLILLVSRLMGMTWCGKLLGVIGKDTIYIYTMHYAIMMLINNMVQQKLLLLAICLAVPILIESIIKGTTIDNLLFKPQKFQFYK